MSSLPNTSIPEVGSDVASLARDYAAAMFADIRSLRRRLVEEWKVRGLTLTREERAALRSEIRDICALLTDLTATD